MTTTTIETECDTAPNKSGVPGDITLGDVGFTMFMHWPDADVDIMLSERGSAFQPTRKVNDGSTPTSSSVDMFYRSLSDDSKLREAGIVVAATYGFCQATARVDFEVALTYENLAKLKGSVRLAQQRMRALSKKWISFHVQGTTVSPSGVMAVSG